MGGHASKLIKLLWCSTAVDER